jgi:hypothetical protein
MIVIKIVFVYVLLTDVFHLIYSLVQWAQVLSQATSSCTHSAVHVFGGYAVFRRKLLKQLRTT